MGFFKMFLTLISLVVTCGSTVFALVAAPEVKYSTHHIQEVANGLKVTIFHPESTYETFGRGIDHPLTKRAGSTIEDSTVSFIESHLKINSSTIKYRVGYSAETARHAYVNQDGIPFTNAVANVAFNHDNKVVAFGSSFVTPKNIAPSKATVTLEAAITTAEKALGGTFNQHPAKIEYLVREDGSVVLTHVVQIQNEAVGIWYQAFVDAHTGDLASIVDFVAHASYFALPITKQAPPQGFQVVTNPQDLIASPFGWHSNGNMSTINSGNNAVSFRNGIISTSGESSPGLNFIYPAQLTASPTIDANVDAARVNAFYVGNVLHDLSYRYGFTEAAFNFQFNNSGKGGLEIDPVLFSVQDPSGQNEGSDGLMMTPPDGQSPRVLLFLWTFTSPFRDSALENDIITHEYTHGITGRMTGGGTGQCLQTIEARALGEGWSDAVAEWTEHASSAVPDYVFASYGFNNAAGIRNHPYSTSTTVNPLRYSSIKTLNLVDIHDIGEVWANILHNLYASLVFTSGWSSTAFTNPDGVEGNNMFLHLLIDALALQPCNPTFVSARDAFIQADINRYSGINRCLLWEIFATRGLGVGAANFVDSSVIPSGC
ncbi:Fungalysin metallopeptidase-domain-containing protein [Collybia nuda]|uniref:Extracellular metalloproteinase n=1 Tax=Collybia nuda TaxID=64659 RepID=A0A9P5XXU4_9AGAR|nr:Fungalysin metallopeptidase-domain-containing protein [Collybia nuda]